MVLNKVNTIYQERHLFVSFDKKYPFFVSDRVDSELPDQSLYLTELRKLTNVPANGHEHIYWMDAKIIEDLKPDELK